MAAEDTNLTKTDAALLREVHEALIGHPLDPDKPGLVVKVERHDKVLFGGDGSGGLYRDNQKFWKIVWTGMGAFIVLQGLWAFILAMKAAGH